MFPLYFDGPFPDKTELNSWHLTPSIYSVGAGVQYIDRENSQKYFGQLKCKCNIDMVVAAQALAELRLVSVFARIPPTTTHPNLTKLFLSSLWSDLSTFFETTQSQESKFCTAMHIKTP